MIERHVFFLGPKSNFEVLAAMRDHDAVVVPSQWAYTGRIADDALRSLVRPHTTIDF